MFRQEEKRNNHSRHWFPSHILTHAQVDFHRSIDVVRSLFFFIFHLLEKKNMTFRFVYLYKIKLQPVEKDQSNIFFDREIFTQKIKR